MGCCGGGRSRKVVHTFGQKSKLRQIPLKTAAPTPYSWKDGRPHLPTTNPDKDNQMSKAKPKSPSSPPQKPSTDKANTGTVDVKQIPLYIPTEKYGKIGRKPVYALCVSGVSTSLNISTIAFRNDIAGQENFAPMQVNPSVVRQFRLVPNKWLIIAENGSKSALDDKSFRTMYADVPEFPETSADEPEKDPI